MMLSSYIILFDTGFAPNPFGRYCTLTCCKPTIRRMAEKGDIVIACASSRAAGPGRLVYAAGGGVACVSDMRGRDLRSRFPKETWPI